MACLLCLVSNVSTWLTLIRYRKLRLKLAVNLYHTVNHQNIFFLFIFFTGEVSMDFNSPDFVPSVFSYSTSCEINKGDAKLER